MKNGLTKRLLYNWRQIILYALAAAAVGGLLWYRLGAMLPGLSQPELDAFTAASSGQAILNNPLFLPHKLIQYLFISLGQDSAFWLRFASTLFAIPVLVAFYRILRTWYTPRVAVISSLLFITSAWFLHYARLATPEILYAGSIGLLWAGIRLRVNKSRTNAILLGGLIAVITLYIPGMVWMVIPILIWQGGTIRKEFKKLPIKFKALTAASFMVGIAPLVYSFWRTPTLIRDWLAMPAQLQLGELWHNLVNLPLWLAFRGPENPVYWLGQVPLLDGLSLMMLVLGVFVLVHYRSLDRVKTVFGTIVIGCLLSIANGPLQLIIVAPLIFVVIASGIALLLQQWFTVFPRNPLAKSLGLLTVILVVSFASLYHVRHYFVAWPKSPQTKQVFDITDKD